ncbi:hypothetical protein GCM10023238_39380 [Streptomyces heliomycini]
MPFRSARWASARPEDAGVEWAADRQPQMAAGRDVRVEQVLVWQRVLDGRQREGLAVRGPGGPFVRGGGRFRHGPVLRKRRAWWAGTDPSFRSAV